MFEMLELLGNRRAAFAPETPNDVVPAYHRRERLTQTLLDHRPPRYEAEVDSVVEQREATAGKRYRAPIDAGCRSTIGHGSMRQARLCGDGLGRRGDLVIAQGSQ